MSDNVVPLCTWAQFTSGAFANLARNYTDPSAQSDILAEATRMCERVAGRRLAPFSGVTESHRAQGVDPDEYTDSANLPMDLQGALGRSYANALGASTLVRHCWVREYAPHHPEMWTYSNVSITVARTYGGSQLLTAGSQYSGPNVDSGHIWFTLGQFIPIASLIYVTYSGGYTIATPSDLRRACKLMTAALVIRELQPAQQQHDPDRLSDEAEAICANYGRD